MYESKCAQEKILIHLQICKIRGLIKSLLCTVDGGTDLEMVRGGAVVKPCMYKLILLSGTRTRVTQLPSLMGGNQV